MPEANNDTCFIIAPIGDPETEIRKRADQVFKHILEPVSKECGYTAMRADHISEPGIITSQVIQHIIDDPMVIADLTGRNPNVFYELAIRHVIRKPYVQIIQAGERIPFDVAGVRTIEINHHDLDSVASSKEEISKQIRSMQHKNCEVDSPVSVTFDLNVLRQSDVPEKRQLAEVLTAINDMKSEISALKNTMESSKEKIRDRNVNRLSFRDLYCQGLDNLWKDEIKDVVAKVAHDFYKRSLTSGSPDLWEELSEEERNKYMNKAESSTMHGWSDLRNYLIHEAP